MRNVIVMAFQRQPNVFRLKRKYYKILYKVFNILAAFYWSIPLTNEKNSIITSNKFSP